MRDYDLVTEIYKIPKTQATVDACYEAYDKTRPGVMAVGGTQTSALAHLFYTAKEYDQRLLDEAAGSE